MNLKFLGCWKWIWNFWVAGNEVGIFGSEFWIFGLLKMGLKFFENKVNNCPPLAKWNFSCLEINTVHFIRECNTYEWLGMWKPTKNEKLLIARHEKFHYVNKNFRTPCLLDMKISTLPTKMSSFWFLGMKFPLCKQKCQILDF
jgi:hypothetical protein